VSASAAAAIFCANALALVPLLDDRPPRGRMITERSYGDVTALRLASRRSRLAGYAVYAYLARGVLIDSGFPRAAAHIVARARSAGVWGAVVTHHHEDHSGGAPALAQAGIPLIMSPATERLIRVPAPIGFYRRFTWGNVVPLDEAPASAALPDGMALVSCPGHSPDHHALWDSSTRTLFGGDLYVGMRVKVARLDERPRAHVQSLRLLAALVPERLFDGHRGLVRDAAASLIRKADWMDETIGRIDAATDTGASESRIVRDVLGGESRLGFISAGDWSSRNYVRVVCASRGDRSTR